MKKITVFTLFVLLFAGAVFAQRVSESQATTVCQRFLMEKNQLTAAENFKFVEVYAQENGDAALYRFQLPDAGFVIVSASMTTPPVLAYSLENPFEMIPPVRDLFHLYKQEIAAAEKNQWQALPKAAAAWERYLSDEFQPKTTRGTSAGPLLTTRWNQNKFYNTYCPWDPASGSYYDYRVPNGCVALACAQIMNYHRYPLQGSGAVTYIPQGYPRQTVYFSQHNYHYDAMFDQPQDYANEIAKLCYHMGVAIQMNYTPDGSGAHTEMAMQKLCSIFKYDERITHHYRGNFLDTLVNEYVAMLKNEIDNHRPVYYAGCTQTYNGCHAYVLDGYDEDDRFSLNYGWGGASNGYYAIDNFVAGPTHYDYQGESLINIFPSQAVPSNYCQGHQRNTASFGYVADGSPTAKPYQQNPDCSWMVATPYATSYQFSFDRLDLNEGDYVTIYNGPTEASGVLVSLTGSDVPTQNYTVNADSVLIKFVGTTNNTDHYGFLIAYNATLPARTCDQVMNLPNVWSATLSDGSDEGAKYMPTTNCTWNISHNFITGYAFTFPKFDLGYGDFVDIYNSTTNPPTLVHRFDIYNMPDQPYYTVPFKKMRVNFVSDNWDQGEGFNMEFMALAALEDYNGIEDMTIYPNPAVDAFTIDLALSQAEHLTVQLLDITGKVLRQNAFEGDEGANQFRFDIQGVAKGLYLLQVSTSTGNSVRKVTVQ